ncbi:hypothetical protein AKJ44_00885 [candidate division MSBL1 archaeon SCGC-AAA261F17]|uniref:Peptidase M28 domain-containing protein n=1 Tax=candidate division MSBL1 archaeon SCGC-AAA261F17 TaxID=1698274 RepID=A0A133V729_9EURY|nr:hypothetical protein AKJ44_00885 [candidate division MSBL1 archaeon SCGC-AAA261F17]
MSPFESQHCFEHIDKLAYEIGPRQAGSRGDSQAADYIKQHFKDCGLQTRFQKFGFVNKITRARTTVSILAGAFILTLFFNPLLSLAITLAGLALAYSLPKMMPGKWSQNVIGSLKPKGEAKRRLVLGAHYDSAPCTRGRKWTLYLRILLPAVSIAFLILALLRFFGLIPLWWLAWLALGVFLIPTCILPFFIYRKFVSSGANDNATGTAIVLELARVMSESPPENTEIWFAAFGAEEQGLIGSKEFLQRSAEPSTLINLDSLGTGSQLSLILGNGVLRRHHTSPLLNDQISEAAQKLEIGVESVWAPLSGHDHIPFSDKEVNVATLSSIELREKNRLDNFLEGVFKLSQVQTRRHSGLHSLEDVPEKIKLENIENAGSLVLDVIEGYDTG